MKIKIKKLELINFKGIKKLEVDFNDNVTYIRGGNGTGKTTVFDGFWWLLFGKDSQGRKEFEIKTLDSQGNEIPYIEHKVRGVFDVMGDELVLQRTMRDKWIKDKGSCSKVFAGNETVYEINNAVVKQSKFQEKICSIVNEELFKLITNPGQFCSSKWQDQRKVLMDMADMGSDLNIVLKAGMTNIALLLEKGKSVEERVRELAATKKKTETELSAIPIRIDEILYSIEGNENRNKEYIKSEIIDAKAEITGIEKEIRILKNENAARTEAEIRVKQAKAKLEKAKAEYEAEKAKTESCNANIRYEKQKKLSNIEYRMADCERVIKECAKNVAEEGSLQKNIEEEYRNTGKSIFVNSVCPCCGRPWEEEELESKINKFNKSKEERLFALSEKLKVIEENTAENEKLIAEKSKELKNLKSEYESIKEENNEMKLPVLNTAEIMAEIEKAEEDVQNCVTDTSELDEELSLLKVRLGELEKELGVIEREEILRKRIEVLKDEDKAKREAIANIEKEEQEIKRFTEAKINMLGEVINSKFRIVKFKLYEKQINGVYAECCQATVGGVPYKDLNNAMKINAGLDIINTLQNYYDVYVPVFVDNKESVNELEQTKSQLICLEVTKDSNIKIC